MAFPGFDCGDYPGDDKIRAWRLMEHINGVGIISWHPVMVPNSPHGWESINFLEGSASVSSPSTSVASRTVGLRLL